MDTAPHPVTTETIEDKLKPEQIGGSESEPESDIADESIICDEQGHYIYSSLE